MVLSYAGLILEPSKCCHLLFCPPVVLKEILCPFARLGSEDLHLEPLGDSSLADHAEVGCADLRAAGVDARTSLIMAGGPGN